MAVGEKSLFEVGNLSGCLRSYQPCPPQTRWYRAVASTTGSRLEDEWGPDDPLQRMIPLNGFCDVVYALPAQLAGFDDSLPRVIRMPASELIGVYKDAVIPTKGVTY